MRRVSLIAALVLAAGLAPLIACRSHGASRTEPTAPVDVLHAGTARAAGLDAEALRAAADLVATAVADGQLRGAVVFVARRGVVALHEGYGWRDEAGEVPMDTDTLFRLASNTKPVVATAVLQLVEDGRLGLDDAVGAHLPSFAREGPDAIRIRHLLSHTGGLRIAPIFLSPLLPESDAVRGLQLEVARFGPIGPEVAPGTSYSYSNPGYNTLGALVEVASGLSLARYLREEVYAPLGMRDACNHESAADPARMSVVSRRGDDGSWTVRWRPADGPDYPFARASGGMIATAHDYAVFCQATLQGGVHGGRRVLAAELVEEALTPQPATDPQGGGGYGFGWGIGGDGVVSHSGSDGTYAWIDRERELVGLVFTQSVGGENPRAAFRAAVAAACLD